MLSRLLFLLMCGNIADYLGNAQKLPRAKRQSLKVQINATDDTIALRFLRPSPNMQLEGFILGYGSTYFSSQYIPLPASGKSYETEVDAEPKYLIVVKQAANPKKPCSGKNKNQKPLQVVIGTVSPTAVYLSWGVLINPQYDWTVMNNCPNERFYTVRYREKDKIKKWVFQLCPTSEAVIENLKPNTMYEFAVKDNSEDGVWNKAVNHKTNTPSKNKENGHIQSTYKIPRGKIQMAPDDMKKLIAIQVIKQVIHNVTNTKHLNPKATVGPSPPEAAPGYKKIQHGVPELTRVEVPETPKPKLAVTERAPESIKATVSTGLDLSKAAPAHSESKTRSLKPDATSSPQQPVSARATIQTFLRSSTPEDDIQSLPSRPRPPKSQEKPSTEPVPHNLQYDPEKQEISQTESAGNVAQPLLARPKPSEQPDVPETKSAPTEILALPSKPRITSRPEIPKTKPAKQIVLDPSTPKAAQPGTTLAPKEKASFLPEPVISPKPEVSRPEPVSTSLPITKPAIAMSSDTFKPEQSTQAYRKTLYPFTTKSPGISEWRRTTMAPKTTRLTPSKPKPSSRPGAPQTKPVPNETQKFIEPKTTQTSESPQTRPVPKMTPWASINLIQRNISEDTRITLVPNETQSKIVPSSSKPKTRQTTRTPFTRVVPKATQKIASSVPKTTVRPHSRSGSPRPRTSARPWTRPAFNGTTKGSVRTKPSDNINWLARSTVPSLPQRVFLRPTQHPYTRRQPFPFNNMTGRRRSPGTVMPHTMRFTVKPTQFSVAQKTQMPKKQPTLSVFDLEDANGTIFNPKPKSELDPQGKPRYTAPYVKYIRRNDSIPCSITESLSHFPVEEASNQDITSPPQSPPSNLTIVTVEGCPSFVILNWEQPENDTVTEYDVISTENGGTSSPDESVITTNQTHSTVENLKPDTSYEFKVKPRNPLGEGPTSNTVAFSTESADPRVSESMSGGKDAIWTELSFKTDGFSECQGKQYVKRTWYKKFVGIQLCNSLRYKIYLSNLLTGHYYNIGDQRGHGEDHCQFVDSFLDGRTGQHLSPDQLPTRKGYYRAFRQQPVEFGKIGRDTQINYVHWYECGTTIPGKW